MNLNNTTKSTQELKNQVLDDVKKVRDDIDQMRDRLTPGQLIDDAIYHRRGGGNPRETFDYLKNNPIGTSFLAIGTFLLMEDAEHRSFETQAKGKAGEARGKMNDAITNAKGKIGEVQERARVKAEEMKGNLQSKFSKGKKVGLGDEGDEFFYGDAGEKVSKVEDFKTTARKGLESAKEKIGNAKFQAEELYQSASSTMKNLDPLTYLALGAGLGTISGASIPVSESELDFVDDKLQQRMIDFRLDLEKALNESANILKNEFIGGVTNVNINLF